MTTDSAHTSHASDWLPDDGRIENFGLRDYLVPSGGLERPKLFVYYKNV